MKITDVITEAANSAQQAAIAISMKKAGKKPKQGVAEGSEFEDAYGQGYSDGYDGKGYNSPFKIGSNEDDEYEDGYSSGRLDYQKMNRDLDEQGVAEAFANPGSGSTGTSRGAKRIANTVRKALAKNSETPDQIAARKDFEAQTDARMRQKKKEQGVAEGESVSLRDMVDVVDRHYPKYYAELSGSDISDRQFERAIINAYKKIMQKQGVAEGSLEEVSQDTARSYAQKARASQKDLINQTHRKGADTDALNKKIKNRQQGMDRAHTDKRYYKDEQGVAEAYQFKGGFPFDVDHMNGPRGINLPSAPTKKFFTDKQKWSQTVDDINSSKYNDNSEYTGVTGRSTVSINGHEWARWSDAQQKGYIELSSMSEQDMAEEASPMIKPPANRFDNKQEAFDYAKEHGGKVFKSTYIDPNTGIKNIIFVVKKEQGVVEGSGPKEKQKTPYRDINSPEYRAAADKQKQRMAKDKAAEPGKKLLAKKGVAEDTELAEEFDLIESIVEMIAEHNGVDAEVVWADLESLTEDELYVFAVTSDPLMEDWQKANKRDRTDGMSQKAVNAYRRENPGSKLKTAVTTKPSKLKKGGKASKRRKSYCSRSRGQMKMHSISCAKTPDKAICKARRRWNC